MKKITLDGDNLTIEDDIQTIPRELDELTKGSYSEHHARHESGGDDEITFPETGIPANGWIEVSDTWTYASATTITVPSGAASIYQKGDKLRFKQNAGTYKYFYVISVANTVLTVTGGTDYTVLNETITVPAYSHIENPMGFPTSFAYTPTVTALAPMTIGTISSAGRFSVRGNVCTVMVKGTGTTAGTASNLIYVTYPIACAVTPPGAYLYTMMWVAGTSTAGQIGIPAGANISAYKIDLSNWGLGANNGLFCANFSYEI